MTYIYVSYKFIILDWYDLNLMYRRKEYFIQKFFTFILTIIIIESICRSDLEASMEAAALPASTFPFYKSLICKASYLVAYTIWVSRGGWE